MRVEDGGSLTHWGVLGMHWGVRRYQNKDGTLTPAGRKRLAKLDEERSKLGGTATSESTSSSSSSQSQKSKSVFDMDDDELKSLVSRMNLERQYRDLMKQNYESLNPSKKDGPLVTKLKEAGVNAIGKVSGVAADYALGSFANKVGNALGLKEDISSVGKKYGKSQQAKDREKDYTESKRLLEKVKTRGVSSLSLDETNKYFKYVSSQKAIKKLVDE